MSFHAVNTGLMLEPNTRRGEDTTPTTPRPTTAPTLPTQPMSRFDDSTTPTRATFALGNQKPLPTEPFPAALTVPETAESPAKSLSRGESLRSSKSMDSEDVDMDDGSEGEDGEGSDDESVNADGTRSGKKKKSQRFWCTDYPPCNLSFTRSEHLARHIRKHTGERPFQCHCSRRFSRLDNLRQHAQTVHVNEEIPGDSLAATGTRFQRQVRTDRVRPPGNRSRANTAGSQTGSIRGHHRNSLSASSISSIGTTYSTTQDVRRRPAPLIMATDPRSRLSMESYGSDQHYRPASPGGFSTPTSATFSTGQNSPRWSGRGSPVHSHTRTQSLYADLRTPSRRLSVPSGVNPFQSPNGYGPPPLTPMNASNSGAFMSPSSSIVGSPTSSTGGNMWDRRGSVSSVSDEAWRRRTWHPDSYNNQYTSRLQNVTTPNMYQQQQHQPQQQQQHPSQSHPHPHQHQEAVRLPGISSFDPIPQRPSTPPHRQPSPMMIDTPSRVPFPQSEPQTRFVERHITTQPPPQYNIPLHRDMNRLELNQQPHSQDGASDWATEANRAVQAQAEQSRVAPGPMVRFQTQTFPSREQSITYSSHPQHASAPPVTPREAKRHGWYHGPIIHNDARQRTSPEGSSSSEGVPGTPGSAAHSELHPNIVHASGWVESQRSAHAPTAYGSYGSSQGREETGYAYVPGSRGEPQSGREEAKPDPMMRLETLVAVATSDPTNAY